MDSVLMVPLELYNDAHDELGRFAEKEGEKLFNTEEHSHTPDDFVQLRLFGKVSPLQDKLQRESALAIWKCYSLITDAIEQGVKVSSHDTWETLDTDQQNKVQNNYSNDNYGDILNDLVTERKKELVEEKDTEVRGDDDWQY